MAGQHCWSKTCHRNLSLRKQRDREAQWAYIQKKSSKISSQKEKYIKATTTLPDCLRDLEILSIFLEIMTPSLLGTCSLHGNIVYNTAVVPSQFKSIFSHASENSQTSK